MAAVRASAGGFDIRSRAHVSPAIAFGIFRGLIRDSNVGKLMAINWQVWVTQ
jgi:hypothetical protein